MVIASCCCYLLLLFIVAVIVVATDNWRKLQVYNNNNFIQVSVKNSSYNH